MVRTDVTQEDSDCEMAESKTALGNPLKPSVRIRSWSHWKVAFEIQLQLSGVTSAKKKTLMLLAAIGVENLSSIIEWTKPKSAVEMTVEELTTLLDDHFGSVETVRMRRLNVLKMKKKEKTWSEFIQRHEAAIGGCEFKDDQLNVKEELAVLTLLNAVTEEKLRSKLMSPENVDKTVKDLYKIVRMNDVTKMPRLEWINKVSMIGCWCCGETGHKKSACPKKSSKCERCGKTGHTKTMCFKQRKIQHVADNSESDSDDVKHY